MAKDRVTIKDVAKEAHVNPSIVSRVINEDSTLSIREETKERVWKAVDKMGYRPNIMARSLRTKRSNLIAVVVSKFIDPYFAAILEGATRAADENGYIIVVFSTEEDRKKGSACIRSIYEYGVDGAILASSYVEEKTMQDVKFSSIPMVLLRRKSIDFGTMGILSDELYGTSLAMDHLIGLGHTKIAHIAGMLYSRSGLKRLEGYRKALHENDIPYRAEYVQESDQTEKSGYDIMMKLLDLPDPPTSIFAFNDTVAFGAMNAIREKGLRIPEDISVIGYDNTFLATQSYPKLTTVDGRMVEIGEMAVKMLIQAIETSDKDSDAAIEKDFTIKPNLVLRGTTAKAKE